jgi:Fur family transcriptional regulator, ferric uptake regulator
MAITHIKHLLNSANQIERDRAESMLRKAQVRVTDARTQVLTTLLVNQRALSHQEVQDALVSMDRVTLYRALDCLTDAGLSHKIAGDDRIFRYSTGSEKLAFGQESGIQHQHAHFKCTRCNKLFCLDDEQQVSSLNEQLKATLQTTMRSGFQNHEIELTIKGWCVSCAQ